MQSAGSVNNFGNQQFGNGMQSQPGTFNPYSQWGQQITAPPVAQGSMGGFGNNLGGFTGSTGREARGSYAGGAVQSAGMFGGNLVNENMLQLQNRWRGSPIKQAEPKTILS